MLLLRVCIESYSQASVLTYSPRVLFVGIMEPVSYDTSSPIISIFPYPGLVVPLGCRLLINMREAGDSGISAGMTCITITESKIDFAERPEDQTQDEKRWV